MFGFGSWALSIFVISVSVSTLRSSCLVRRVLVVVLGLTVLFLPNFASVVSSWTLLSASPCATDVVLFSVTLLKASPLRMAGSVVTSGSALDTVRGLPCRLA